MSYVTNGRESIEQATQLVGKLNFDVPISVRASDLYILFGKELVSNPLLVEASVLGSSINEAMGGYPLTPNEEYWLQLCHAQTWREAISLGEISSRNPEDWLVYSQRVGGLEHILWALAHKRDVVDQFYWAHDIVGVGCKDLNAEFMGALPPIPGSWVSSKSGEGLSRSMPDGIPLSRHQNFRWGMCLNFVSYPLSRRGKQPRGKSLADKRKGNLGPKYRKELVKCQS